jgi:hypothetical protein
VVDLTVHFHQSLSVRLRKEADANCWADLEETSKEQT